jgi:hypothetical protein
MTLTFLRTVSRLAILPVALAASGCFVPGGGWTMRGGIDLRRHRKPSAFVELVDTRWDEYNRVAEINMMNSMGDSQGVAAPTGYGAPLTPTNGMTLPGPPTSGIPVGEPNQLPGAPAESLPPPPPLPSGDSPNAQSALSGPQMGPSADSDDSLRAQGDDEFNDAADADEELARSKSNWVQRVAGRVKARSARSTTSTTRATSETEKPAQRPGASRLFSRPR